MDTDRIVGAVKQAAGLLRKAAGRLLGDARLVVEGEDEIAAGKVQNALGGARDELKDQAKK